MNTIKRVKVTNPYSNYFDMTGITIHMRQKDFHINKLIKVYIVELDDSLGQPEFYENELEFI